MQTLKMIGSWAGRIFLFLLLLLMLSYGYVYWKTEQRIHQTYSFTKPELSILPDSFSIARGSHLYQIRGCVDCHGPSLEGGVFMDEALMFRLSVPNLTKGKGGLPADFTAQDWVRVLRHGVDRKGQSLWLMPSHESTVLSREDLASLIAYCQSMPAVDSQLEKLKEIGPVGRVLMMLDQVAILPAERIDHQTSIVMSTPTALTAYGQYLATTCQGCHRPNLKGGAPLAPGYPEVPDITAAGTVGKWSEEDFIATLREGRSPEGKVLRNEFMPWQNMKHFTDDELKAIHRYLQSLR